MSSLKIVHLLEVELHMGRRPAPLRAACESKVTTISIISLPLPLLSGADLGIDKYKGGSICHLYIRSFSPFWLFTLHFDVARSIYIEKGFLPGPASWKTSQRQSYRHHHHLSPYTFATTTHIDRSYYPSIPGRSCTLVVATTSRVQYRTTRYSLGLS